MALFYKLELLTDKSQPSDDAVYIHIRENPPIYLSHIHKERYDILPPEEKHEFPSTLFSIEGVVELSLKAYRIWLMKSPIYSWKEVIEPVLAYLVFYYSTDEAIPINGSALPGDMDQDTSRARLNNVNERRTI